MKLTKITTVEELRTYLAAAIQLEHATIPPYLIALYSIKPGANSDASQLLRVVVVEEMLHLTLAANLLNAVGGTPALTAPGFVPVYPAFLPDGETDFQANLERFSPETIQGFLKIERPGHPQPEDKRYVRRSRAGKAGPLPIVSGDDELHFYSIGEFYEEIWRGFRYLHNSLGDKLFCGDRARQVTPEYYYSGGGRLFPIVDIASAGEAVRLISEQGEGHGGGIFDHEGEISHYYRLEQILLQRYYRANDQPGKPTGPSFNVDWDAVYPIKANARLEDYPEGSELHTAAMEYIKYYEKMLALFTQAFSGKPELLVEGVAIMFRIKEKANALMRNPIPGSDGLNAAPIFVSPQAKA